MAAVPIQISERVVFQLHLSSQFVHLFGPFLLQGRNAIIFYARRFRKFLFLRPTFSFYARHF